MNKTTTLAVLITAATLVFASGCDTKKYFNSTPEPPAPSQQTPVQTPADGTKPDASKSDGNAKQTSSQANPATPDFKPDSITVLVNKQHGLPKEYAPADLVNDPEIPFTFSGYDEKRMMRKVMADALKKMFVAAKADGISLAGVSAYRSYATQEAIFNSYVQQDGLEKAKTYSAVPGTSEHETGLSIDVSSSDGKCAAEDCFGASKESNWIEKHAAEHGFIIRYLKGKEAITGYQYEPWHIRYVGQAAAQEIAKKGITLEEYEGAKPVS
jgi:zinc D-Ala-D-Ala carboxypeptidase